MKVVEAIEDVLDEDPKTRDNNYLWLYMAKVLRKMGFDIFILLDKRMPSPESLLTERRTILNKRNKFGKHFVPEEGVSYSNPSR